MNKEEALTITPELEREVVNILDHSSLYHGMSVGERQRLLHYLVSSYFNPQPNENRGLQTTHIPSEQ
ncbi:MAG TPA: hypothetical protein VF903_02205 [Nitrospirota bacterium]